MEWDPNERDAWVADAQRWLTQITGVLQCKIDLDGSGEVEGIHVVAGMDRDPRHIVRDVEGLLKARLDLDVYYKKIGVVQVLDNSGAGALPDSEPAAGSPEASGSGSTPGSTVTFYPPGARGEQPGAASAAGSPREDERSHATAPAPAPVPAILVAEDLVVRITCEGVGVMASEMVTRAEVRLKLGDMAVEGVKEGPNHADSDLSLLAEATLVAVSELISDPVLLHLREARLTEIAGKSVVLSAVDLVEGRLGQTLYGACGTGHNRHQAVVYSILDALNRRLSQLGLKTLAAKT